MTQKVFKIALDALEGADQIDCDMQAAITAIKEALAQQEQEPVAIVTGDAWETDIRFLPEGMALPPDTKLYTATPQRTEQEPMAFYCCFQGQEEGEFFLFGSLNSERYPRQYKTPLYEHLAPRTWVGLAAEDRLTAKYMQDAPDGIQAVIDYIEAKLRELNT